MQPVLGRINFRKPSCKQKGRTRQSIGPPLRKRLSTSYKEKYAANAAVHDTDRIEEALGGEMALNLYRPLEAAEHEVRFKVYSADKAVLLSDILPHDGEYGIPRQRGNAVSREAGRVETLRLIREFSMMSADETPVRVSEIRGAFHDAFRRVWSGDIADDGFNCLVVTTGLLARKF